MNRSDFPIAYHGQYERIDIPLDPSDIIPLIRSPGKKSEVLGILVRTTGTRLNTFVLNLDCVCGTKGVCFYLERQKRWPGKSKVPFLEGWHLNLYGRNRHGHLVLMTRDHVIPRSKGGPNRMHNCQTMCAPCNRRKADKMPEGIDER